MSKTEDTPFYTAWLLLNDKEFLQQNASVKPDVFPRGSLGYLVALALRHWAEHRAVLTNAVVNLATENESSALRRFKAEKEQVRQIFRDLGVYAVEPEALPMTRELARRWLERRTGLLATERAQESFTQGNLDEARAHLSTAHLRLEERTAGLRLSKSMQEILETKRSTKGAIPTGFDILDTLWMGGMRRGEVGIVAAPTGTGKSMILCAMAAEAFWAGVDVLYYTYELTPQQIMQRIGCGIVRSGFEDLRNRNWGEELKRAAHNRGDAIPVVDIDVRGEAMTWPDLMSDLKDYKDDHGSYPGLLILDSADDLAPLSRSTKVHEQLRDAYTYLRLQVAQEKHIAVWTSSQFNREAIEKAKVSLKHVADAYAKAQKVHYFFGFAQANGQKQDMDGPKMTMYVLKDSLHGTAGGSLELAVMFGQGDNGYPGWEVEKTWGLSVPQAYHKDDDPRDRDDEDYTD